MVEIYLDVRHSPPKTITAEDFKEDTDCTASNAFTPAPANAWRYRDEMRREILVF